MCHYAAEIPAEPSSVKWWNWAAFGWEPSLDTNEVIFALPSTRLILKLGLDWTPPSIYSLRIDIVSETLFMPPAAPLPAAQVDEHTMASSSDREQDTSIEARMSQRGILGATGGALE